MAPTPASDWTDRARCQASRPARHDLDASKLRSTTPALRYADWCGAVELGLPILVTPWNLRVPSTLR